MTSSLVLNHVNNCMVGFPVMMWTPERHEEFGEFTHNGTHLLFKREEVAELSKFQFAQFNFSLKDMERKVDARRSEDDVRPDYGGDHYVSLGDEGECV